MGQPLSSVSNQTNEGPSHTQVLGLPPAARAVRKLGDLLPYDLILTGGGAPGRQ
ncbi:MAG: hypothetical protein AAGC72_07690 [Planctomycetota bacterium]